MNILCLRFRDLAAKQTRVGSDRTVYVVGLSIAADAPKIHYQIRDCRHAADQVEDPGDTDF